MDHPTGAVIPVQDTNIRIVAMSTTAAFLDSFLRGSCGGRFALRKPQENRMQHRLVVLKFHFLFQGTCHFRGTIGPVAAVYGSLSRVACRNPFPRLPRRREASMNSKPGREAYTNVHPSHRRISGLVCIRESNFSGNDDVKITRSVAPGRLASTCWASLLIVGWSQGAQVHIARLALYDADPGKYAETPGRLYRKSNSINKR